MSLVVVIATGQSLTSWQVDLVHEVHAIGKCKAVAVSNAYQLAPWADAMVANDMKWWRQHPEALKFAGRRFCGAPLIGMEQTGMELIPPNGRYRLGSNSGLQAMRVAHEKLGATHIVLLGVDMHGTHYFGPHPAPLRNTTQKRFKEHIQQFRNWRGCDVINCSPGSALKFFPMGDLREVLRS